MGDEDGNSTARSRAGPYRLAMGSGARLVTENVAGEGIDGALPLMPRVKQHFRALAWKEVPDALRIVEESGASLVARCVSFCGADGCEKW